MKIKLSETELGFCIRRSFWGDWGKPEFLYTSTRTFSERTETVQILCYSVSKVWLLSEVTSKSQIWNQGFNNSYVSTHYNKVQNDRNWLHSSHRKCEPTAPPLSCCSSSEHRRGSSNFTVTQQQLLQKPTDFYSIFIFIYSIFIYIYYLFILYSIFIFFYYSIFFNLFYFTF